ncbi:MAG: PadR family transcriptional regulator [Bdellovibrionales bacterium]|jgi:PadR family transcriptional regulator PadR|nr:PadR family transcriptional regulator [Bdellovibrionales bacterium]
MNTQFHKGVVEMCVLALVAKEDRYGYELVSAISTRIPISEGTIYPILRRLTQEGYFETYLVESNEGPPRKYYRMTKNGRTFTQSLVEQWTHFTESVEEIIHPPTKRRGV